MPRHFRPYTALTNNSQYYKDAVAAKQSFYVEFNKVVNLESVA